MESSYCLDVLATNSSRLLSSLDGWQWFEEESLKHNCIWSCLHPNTGKTCGLLVGEHSTIKTDSMTQNNVRIFPKLSTFKSFLLEIQFMFLFYIPHFLDLLSYAILKTSLHEYMCLLCKTSLAPAWSKHSSQSKMQQLSRKISFLQPSDNHHPTLKQQQDKRRVNTTEIASSFPGNGW